MTVELNDVDYFELISTRTGKESRSGFWERSLRKSSFGPYREFRESAVIAALNQTVRVGVLTAGQTS
jgi:hypothetical protein